MRGPWPTPPNPVLRAGHARPHRARARQRGARHSRPQDGPRRAARRRVCRPGAPARPRSDPRGAARAHHAGRRSIGRRRPGSSIRRRARRSSAATASFAGSSTASGSCTTVQSTSCRRTPSSSRSSHAARDSPSGADLEAAYHGWTRDVRAWYLKLLGAEGQHERRDGNTRRSSSWTTTGRSSASWATGSCRRAGASSRRRTASGPCAPSSATPSTR